MLVSWAVRHGAWLYARFQVHSVGKTSYFSLKQQDYHGELFMFGETVFGQWEPRLKPKALPTWDVGIWVGRSTATNQHSVLTEQGLMRTRSVRQKQSGENFDVTVLQAVKGLPWNSEAEADMMPDVFQREGPEPKVRHEGDYAKFMRLGGRTIGCSACSGAYGYHHSAGCRKRKETWESAQLLKPLPGLEPKCPVQLSGEEQADMEAARAELFREPGTSSTSSAAGAAGARGQKRGVSDELPCDEAQANQYFQVAVIVDEKQVNYPVVEERSEHEQQSG